MAFEAANFCEFLAVNPRTSPRSIASQRVKGLTSGWLTFGPRGRRQKVLSTVCTPVRRGRKGVLGSKPSGAERGKMDSDVRPTGRLGGEWPDARLLLSSRPLRASIGNLCCLPEL